jgi:hypothetical protein
MVHKRKQAQNTQRANGPFYWHRFGIGFQLSAQSLTDSVCMGRAPGCPTYAVGLQTGRSTP